MIQSKEKEIDGVRYECNSLPARRGLKVYTKLVRIIGPSVGMITDGADSLADLMAGSLKAGVIGKAVEALVSRIDEDVVLNLVLELLSGMVRFGPDDDGKIVQMDVGRPEMFDLAYSANYGELLKAVMFSMEVNLPAFFGNGRIGGVFKKAREAADRLASKSASESASTQS